MTDLESYLRLMVERAASDLFFTADTPLHIKIDGVIAPMSDSPLRGEQIHGYAHQLMSDEQAAAFADKPEMNLGFSREGLGRFRINIFRQRGQVSMVVRHLREDIPTIEQLNLPLALKQLVMRPRGMILVVGATGSGKSTTLASMIDYRNGTTISHILTIEDPIEYAYRYKRSIIDQREIGFDTQCYADALTNAMREAPDVILIGEIRDQETMQHAISYAETGHLCLSTLHASNANQALQRICSFFPEARHPQLFMDLSLNVCAVISQRLLTGVDGKRLPAVEVLIKTPHIGDLIQKGQIDVIRDAMEKSNQEGMQTFDQSIFQLYKGGKITAEEALKFAESTSNLGLQIRLHRHQMPGGRVNA